MFSGCFVDVEEWNDDKILVMRMGIIVYLYSYFRTLQARQRNVISKGRKFLFVNIRRLPCVPNVGNINSVLVNKIYNLERFWQDYMSICNLKSFQFVFYCSHTWVFRQQSFATNNISSQTPQLFPRIKLASTCHDVFKSSVGLLCPPYLHSQGYLLSKFLQISAVE